MTAAEILTGEHVPISKMLDIVSICAQKVKIGDFADLDTVRKAVDFFRNYGDGWHHMKEEKILFPLLLEKANLGSPVRMFIEEHTLGRKLIHDMALVVSRIDEGDKDAGDLLAEKIEAYTKMLAQHIIKEDRGLFKSADKVLSAAEQSWLLAEFARMEAEKRGWDAAYLRMVEELAAVYGLA